MRFCSKVHPGVLFTHTHKSFYDGGIMYGNAAPFHWWLHYMYHGWVLGGEIWCQVGVVLLRSVGLEERMCEMPLYNDQSCKYVG